MCCHFVWLLGNGLPHFLLCWITPPFRLGLKVIERDWQGRPPAPYLCLRHCHLCHGYASSRLRSNPFIFRLKGEGKEDEEEAVQGVHIKFKGKCSKIKIVNEMIVQRGGVRWWRPSPWWFNSLLFLFECKECLQDQTACCSYDGSWGN